MYTLLFLEEAFAIKGGIEKFNIRKCFIKLDRMPRELLDNIKEGGQIDISMFMNEQDDWRTKLPVTAEFNQLESKPFKCSICEYCVADGRAFLEHLNKVHMTEKLFKCSICGFNTVQILFGAAY